MLVSGDERHHLAQTAADLFELVSSCLIANSTKLRSTNLVFQQEFLSVCTVLDLFKSLSLIALRATSVMTLGPVTYPPNSALLEIE